MGVTELMQQQNLAVERAEVAKRETEYARFKQDCRKRAMEFAMEDARRLGGFTPVINDPQFMTAIQPPQPFDVIGTAEKYYTWLISGN